MLEILGDRYKLLDCIGRGRMVTVFRVLDLHTDHVFASKILQMIWNDHQSLVTRFKHSVEVSSEWQHPSIIQAFEYGQTNHFHYVIMELVEGTNLSRPLYSHGIFDVDRVITIAHHVALGLGAVHCHGIVHRGINTRNILLCHNDSAKISSFSLSATQAAPYFPPEGLRREIVTPATDVYTLGIVMYEMLTCPPIPVGIAPASIVMQYIHDNPVPPRQHNPNIPISLDEIIMRCIEKEPEMRFRDGSQLARALEALM